MPLKVNVGLSRKVGEANYGSRGASVHVEVELDAGLAADPPRLQEKIRLLFDLARSSVAEELHGEVNTGHGPNSNGTRTNGTAAHQPANGHGDGNGINNGNGTSRRTVPRSATQSQVKALYAIRLSPGPFAVPSCPVPSEDGPSREAAVGLPTLFDSRGSMNARNKLNSYALKAILLASGGIGLAFGSWHIFVLAALILVGLALHDGSIRPSPRWRRFR